ncbi:MAG: hypothetical protein GY819_05265 [Planctomycetaceae bacterium]|nr:hypothetical protein [Planctomycetaceae bacterium]MCP4462192.1 hypothetical protein [Planctomycetaceae bacterium]
MNTLIRKICGYGTLAFAASLLCLSIGCNNSSITEVEDLETVSLYSQSDQLAQTLEYIRGLDRYEMDSFRDKVNSGLNRWVSGQDDVASDWQLATLASELPETITSQTAYNQLDDKSFFANDADYLQEIFWLQEIANRVANSNVVFHQEYIFQSAKKLADEATLDSWENDSDDLLASAIQLIQPELVDGDDNSKVKQLAQTVKLFDWSVRNVHLLETPSWPTEETIKTTSVDPRVNPKGFAPATGTAGPGYTRHTWQVLTYGKGDFLERAKVFAGLCNQINVPVAILAIPTEEGDSRPYEEWLCGAVIGDEMYLFDPLLGLPILGNKKGSIATLSDVRKDPELLNRLSLSEEEAESKLDYRVTKDDLDNLIALVVAPPESLSRRMLAAEGGLTGENRLSLTMDPDAIAETFKNIDGINSVELWHAPFSTKLFRDKVAEAEILSFDPEVRARLKTLLNEERYIDDFVQFRTARNCFLRGIFQSDLDRDVRSALSYYYSFMYTDDEIAMIDRDDLLQKKLGIWKGADQSFSDWKSQVIRMKQYMGTVRADAAFFLSMCSFENAMPFTTLKWLQRIRNYDDAQRWSVYLPYYKGRAYESSGKYEEAAQEYGDDQSAQRHGSLLRKRWMNELQQDAPASGS